MNKLKTLKIKKLLKELDFLEENYISTKEIVNEADNEFMGNVLSFLDNKPEIKDEYNKKLDETVNNIVKNTNKEKDSLSEPIISENIKKDQSKETKKIYRDIVKITHPDKVDDEDLNQLYLEATELYNTDDKIGLYKICDILNIDYDIDDDDESFIKDKIDKIKEKISFLESTFTWKWLNTNEEEQKEKILMHFIMMKIK